MRYNNTIWGRIYTYLNFVIIGLIIMRFFTPMNFSGILVYAMAALLIIGLLDSNEQNTWRQNMIRHAFDLFLLLWFAALYYG
ncbi:hypothetical protein [Macrococcus sp. DPC7161]|uniref:hypothetical protein n=1 Tax=Macrococcus sp. DPC7161 TaxID=2507060 RepID=UPI00100AD694|nr:hypothetical protein [Macrococcus sp. DPC7161]RXK17642.1 hypothetical protein ER639_08875 [Macrococcus sp. DPC7161]